MQSDQLIAGADAQIVFGGLFIIFFLGMLTLMALMKRDEDRGLFLDAPVESPKIWEDSIMLIPHDEPASIKKAKNPKHKDLDPVG